MTETTAPLRFASNGVFDAGFFCWPDGNQSAQKETAVNSESLWEVLQLTAVLSKKSNRQHPRAEVGKLMPADLANIVPDRETLVQRALRLAPFACQSKRGAILDCCADIEVAEGHSWDSMAAALRQRLTKLLEGVGP